MRVVLGRYGILYNLRGEISWWWRRHFTREGRRHIVYTDLDPRHWHDEDSRMLHACMTILGEFIDANDGADALDKFSDELQNPESIENGLYGTVSYTSASNGSQAARQREATAIWRWWTIERPADMAREEELVDELYGRTDIFESEEVEGVGVVHLRRKPQSEEWENLRRELDAIEVKIYTDAQSYLHRLVDIRYSLWT